MGQHLNMIHSIQVAMHFVFGLLFIVCKKIKGPGIPVTFNGEKVF